MRVRDSHEVADDLEYDAEFGGKIPPSSADPSFVPYERDRQAMKRRISNRTPQTGTADTVVAVIGLSVMAAVVLYGLFVAFVVAANLIF